VIFVDTSYWVALRNRRDPRHGMAIGLLEQYAATTLITTNHVIGETWTFLRRRAGHRSAVAFLDLFETSPRANTVMVDAGSEQQAWRWLREHDEREYSFVDATSFAMMRALRIDDALAFDGDFSAAGFVELRA
jgi:predicted nucleic acid-binding protein